MPTAQRYDAIVIGTGQGGGPLAGRMADAGWRVAVIERVNRGCTPTKTMVATPIHKRSGAASDQAVEALP